MLLAPHPRTHKGTRIHACTSTVNVRMATVECCPSVIARQLKKQRWENDAYCMLVRARPRAVSGRRHCGATCRRARRARRARLPRDHLFLGVPVAPIFLGVWMHTLRTLTSLCRRCRTCTSSLRNRHVSRHRQRWRFLPF